MLLGGFNSQQEVSEMAFYKVVAKEAFGGERDIQRFYSQWEAQQYVLGGIFNCSSHDRYMNDEECWDMYFNWTVKITRIAEVKTYEEYELLVYNSDAWFGELEKYMVTEMDEFDF